MTWAYSDESERAATMYFGVLLIEPAKVAKARRALNGLLLPGQRRVHTKNESARRRRQLLHVVAAIDAESVVFSLRRPAGLLAVHARSRLVAEATQLVIERAVVRWEFDRQDEKQAARDRHAVEIQLRTTEHRVAYDHVPSSGEPLLWAVDAVVWAVASGGDWRRRVGDRLRVEELRP